MTAEMKASRAEGLPTWFGVMTVTVTHQTSGEETVMKQQKEPLPRGVDVSQERRLPHQPLHLTVPQSGTSCRFYSQLVVLRDASLIEIQETVWQRSTKRWPDAERSPMLMLRVCAS